MAKSRQHKHEKRGEAADRPPVLPLGVMIGALVTFIAQLCYALPMFWSYMRGNTAARADLTPISALLLNIALILLGWFRYRDLRAEIAAHRRDASRARSLALTDALTGALNRRSLMPELDARLEQARNTGRAVAFLMVDIDRFKQVNDLNGHRAGDAVLVEVVSRIRALLPDHACIARLGGDEFACVLDYDSDAPGALEEVCARLVVAASRPIAVAGGSICVTLSLGIASSLDIAKCKAPGSAALLHMADMAMYHAKKHGRDRFHWYTPEMESELQRRSALENGIRRGIAQGEFVPYYEQQVDLETGRLTGFEMLARWQNPELGLITPDAFIPVAEEMNVIAELSETVIAQALRDAREWDRELILSVNISPVQIRDPWFAHRLVKLLAAANFPGERLEIEISEGCLREDMALVRSMITSLKNQGVRVSLDDFGNSYASMSELRALPFDRVKIDRGFIAQLTCQEESEAAVHAISAIAQGFDLPVTVEGVESGPVRNLLRKMGRFKGQGYYYGRPEPAERVRARLRSEARLVVNEPPRTERDATKAERDNPNTAWRP
ncbi:bifunctional diguanylate cyclase/phosphodiesterase [Croceicoccus sp. YJ47]|uniref:putative bifunctional diguanylate cyclase/phosphodiesterase n=1 Tax=Croceicoccus sp. YJ47 TaxID=2798724 RepID=UPI0019208744|nr:EAL domain-containing protein [Croceicoccus sp. YJ47]QQN73704.1 EAL domain-containing protein [Croceicoccus sp. YJ47]